MCKTLQTFFFCIAIKSVGNAFLTNIKHPFPLRTEENYKIKRQKKKWLEKVSSSLKVAKYMHGMPKYPNTTIQKPPRKQSCFCKIVFVQVQQSTSKTKIVCTSDEKAEKRQTGKLLDKAGLS